MTIENLIKVIPPPKAPISAFGGPWEPVEAEIGTMLPQDYKDLSRLYGHGKFLQFLVVHSPICRSPYGRLAPTIRSEREFFGDNELPYRLWPEAGGLLLCGGTDFMDHLYWLPRGPPDKWRMVQWGRGFQEFEAFDCDLTDFIAGLVTGEIQPKDFPGPLDGFEDEELFTSWPDRWPERD